VPRESFDAAENLPKEAPCQAALGQLQDKVSGVPNEAATGLEEPLLETRQGQLWMARGRASGAGLDPPSGRERVRAREISEE